MEIMSQIGEKMLFSSLLEDAGVYSETPEGVGGEGIRVRRRRKKAKGGSAAEGAEAKKRRLSDEQVRFLEMNFGKERKLESGRKVDLASELGLDPKQVAVWFQNRRARWKSKQLEDEFLKLKAAHDTVVVDKCHLETEVLRLKERISEAEEEIRKLSRGVEMGSAGDRSGGSPCSSFSAETHQPIFLEEAGVEGEADLMYIHDYNCNNYMMEWMNLYGM